jgi:hypothetical protein
MTKKPAKTEPKKKPGPKKKDAPKVAEAAAPEAKAAGPKANEPSADPKLRELARHHRDKYITLKNAMGKAQKNLRLFGKEVKEDGLSMRQIKLMVELSTPEGEAAWRMTIANDLIAAQYQGAAIGQQLTLFLEPDRTPAVDIAYDQGVQDSMDGKTAHPGYDPSTPQHAKYMDGFHAETERRLKAGIKKAVEEDDAPTDRAATIQAARAANVPSPDKLN